ncbi:glycosyltransferase family 9 protein [Rudanella lutea]|uniref:glycosyltransferase family 9 protein n=1 Tax=Rudanella lutea TaxID=451374 RepID=UPI00036182B7|nr:glycosyltransferase family 9 protein [Rudanella lutea]
MNLKTLIRQLKTSPWLAPFLAAIDTVLWLSDWVAILSTPHRPRPETLLILRLDVFGDYLMFRGFLEQIRQSPTYSGHRIIYCGNAAVRSVAETFDSAFVDEFIWTDIYALSTNLQYRFRFVQQLRRLGVETVFCPTYSRVLVLDDFLAWASGATQRIGCRTDYVNIKRWEAALGDRLYTRLIDSGPGLLFEHERNRRIVEEFLQKPVRQYAIQLNPALAAEVPLPQPYIVLSLGAGQEFRVWSAERFASVAYQLQREYPNHAVVLTGSPSEQVYADQFKRTNPLPEPTIDLTGQLSIPQLAYVLSRASLLISNETGTVHLAAATQTPTVVISQGKSLIRWHPYPPELATHIVHVYPPEVEANRHRLEQIAPDLNPESPYQIATISTDRVYQSAANMLQATGVR